MTTAIDDLLTEWTDCERTGDARRLDAMLADDFVGIGPVGFVLDRDAWLARLGPDLHYDRLELDEVSTHRHGDAAIVVAHQHAVGTAMSNPTPPDTRVSFTVVAGDDDKLRIAGIQYSFIGPPWEPPHERHVHHSVEAGAAATRR
jgi:ketosteroid isomerase-like protein